MKSHSKHLAIRAGITADDINHSGRMLHFVVDVFHDVFRFVRDDVSDDVGIGIHIHVLDHHRADKRRKNADEPIGNIPQANHANHHDEGIDDEGREAFFHRGVLGHNSGEDVKASGGPIAKESDGNARSGERPTENASQQGINDLHVPRFRRV